MSYKKLLQEHSPKDLADSFVFPVKLSARQQKGCQSSIGRSQADAAGKDDR